MLVINQMSQIWLFVANTFETRVAKDSINDNDKHHVMDFFD